MYEEFLSERIATLRTIKGVSARDMSLSMGQADNYINAIENKKSLPSISTFFIICEYLGVTPKEFFDEEIANPSLMNDLISELKHMNDAALTHMLGLAREMRGKK